MPRKYTLDKLENEIHRLSAEGQDIRRRLGDNLKYLGDHHGSFIIKTVINVVAGIKENIKGKILDSLWEKKKSQPKLAQIIDRVIKKTFGQND